MENRRIWLLVWMFLVSSTVMVSCDDDDESNMDADRQQVTEFMTQAAASDMFEIETGNMAVSKGALASTQTFGAELVSDHTNSSNELKALAAKMNVTLPTTLPADKQALRTELAALNAMPFDRRFASVQVDAHRQAVALYEDAEGDIENAEVRAFIQKTLPVLREHLQHAIQHKTMVDAM